MYTVKVKNLFWWKKYKVRSHLIEAESAAGNVIAPRLVLNLTNGETVSISLKKDYVVCSDFQEAKKQWEEQAKAKEEHALIQQAFEDQKAYRSFLKQQEQQKNASRRPLQAQPTGTI